MAHGFYEMLGVDPSASAEEIRTAYQRRLAELVRRLRAARRQGADVRILEGQERDIREAMEVLADGGRRRSYDAFRLATSQGLPEGAEPLWEQARRALTDPIAHAALAAVRALTDLPVGDPLPEPLAPYGSRRSTVPALRRAPAEVVQLPPPPPPAHTASYSFEEDDDDPEIMPLPRAAEAPLPAPEHELPTEGRLRLVNGGSPAAHGHSPPPRAQPPVEVEEPGDEIDRLIRAYGFDGRFLKAVRESRHMSIEDMARATRISTRYLAAIEDNTFDKLPAATFVRGYMKQIAEVLTIADRGVVDGYMSLYQSARG